MVTIGVGPELAQVALPGQGGIVVETMSLTNEGTL